MAVLMTKADVVARFNALVRDQLSPSLGAAPHYYGFAGSAQPAVNNHADLGPRAEPGIPTTEPAMSTAQPSLAMADAGTQVANSIFNLLHNFAMTYTRVRQAKSVYIFGGAATEGVMTLTALKPGLALYFPLPEIPPITGDPVPVTTTDVDDFLDLLRIKVNSMRNDAQYMHIYGVFSCHSACHTACHGSRGRR